MSYDVYLEIDTGGPEPASLCEGLNHTYNCGGMFRFALGEDGINSLHAKTVADVLPRIRAAVIHIGAHENAAAYKAMNPLNGWGSHDTAKEFLQQLLANCEAHPKATIRVS